MKYIYSFALLCLYQTAVCQVTFVVNNLPNSTPEDATVYISGDFEGWSGGQEAYRLEKSTSGDHTITLEQRSGTINFKFTLGSWDSVEKNALGTDISNRTYTFGGSGEIVEFSIENWDSDNSKSISTAASNVHVLDSAFEMPQLNRTRRIWMYLPPDYASSNECYPVLYMHDGQNLFDKATAFSGEWKVDETLNKIYQSTGFGLIVVGIDNGGQHRINEYSPWTNPNYGGGEGSDYVDFIVGTLKPFIDKQFRTLDAAEHTGMMGSSLGGLITFYATLEYPDIFGKAGVFSPSLWFSPQVDKMAEMKGKLTNTRLYFLGGEKEPNMRIELDEVTLALKNGGFDEINLSVNMHPEGTHNESFWSDEFYTAISWLWGLN